MHISHTKSFNIPVSIALATLAHMINVYEICINTTNYLIFNMQDFRYCLWTSTLDCFGQLISPPCSIMVQIILTLQCFCHGCLLPHNMHGCTKDNDCSHWYSHRRYLVTYQYTQRRVQPNKCYFTV